MFTLAHRKLCLVAVTATLLCPRAASGQTPSGLTGALAGRVTDQTGAALTDVTVEVAGASLMGTQEAQTNENGLFRVSLPPGVYKLIFTRNGFTTVERRDVVVSLSATATVDVMMAVAGPQASIAVTGRPPILDRQSSTTVVNFDAPTLDNLPTPRSMAALLSATPGVLVGRFDVGGSAGVLLATSSAYGIPANRNTRPMLEGIDVFNLNPLAFTLDYGAFQEVSVATTGQGADTLGSGVMFQFVTKSGGNRYTGSFHADVERRGWQSFNIDETQIKAAERAKSSLTPSDNRLWSYHDLDGDIGGFIKRDRVWWYGSAREQDVQSKLVALKDAHSRTTLWSQTAKLTLGLSPGQRVILFAHLSQNDMPYRTDAFKVLSPINSADSTANQTGAGWVGKAEWRATWRSMYAEARVGQFTARRAEAPRSTDTRRENSVTFVIEGANRDWETAWRRPQAFASATYLGGPHELKFGGEATRVLSTETWHKGYSNDLLYLIGGRTDQVVFFLTPSQSESGMWWYSAYVSDNWRASDRLSMNLGVRFDRIRSFLPAQSHGAGRFSTPEDVRTFAARPNLIAWNIVSPRLGATYALTADARTLLKASYGTAPIIPGPDLGFNANENSDVWYRQYDWVDANGDGLREPEETGERTESRGGTSVESIDSDLELRFVREVAAWVERELPSATAIRTGFVWNGVRKNSSRQSTNRPGSAFNEESFVRDPGPDPDHTSDDGPPIRAYRLAAAYRDVDPTYVVANVPNSDTDYWTWETSATRRWDGRWSFAGGFAETWNHDHANGYAGQMVRGNAYALTPNDLINTHDGRHEFAMWSLKAYGTYQAPWRVRITPFLRHQSGQPFGRTINVSPADYGTTKILAEPIGTRRMPNVTLVDLRVEKAFWQKAGPTVSTFLDVFNLFNANPEQNVNWISDKFLQPLAIVPPRIARLGVKVNW